MGRLMADVALTPVAIAVVLEVATDVVAAVLLATSAAVELGLAAKGLLLAEGATAVAGVVAVMVLDDKSGED